MKKIVPLILTAAVIFSGCSSAKNNANETVKNNVPTGETYIFAGKIQSDSSAAVMSKISGRILEMKADVGTQVNAGDPIIYLDTKDIQNQINQAQAAVDTAEAGLSKVQSGARPEQVASAEAAVEGAKTAYQVMQSSFDRQKQLFDGGYSSQQVLDQAQQQLAQVKSQYEQAEQQLNTLRNGATKDDLNVAASTAKQAQAALEIAKTQLDNGTITAPISGIITAKNVNQGEIAAAGQPLMTIVNNGGLHIDGYMPEDLVSTLKVGQQVVVKVPDLSDKTFSGQISVINPQIDSRNKDVLVRVVINDKIDSLTPGMFAEIGLKR